MKCNVLYFIYCEQGTGKQAKVVSLYLDQMSILKKLMEMCIAKVNFCQRLHEIMEQLKDKYFYKYLISKTP